jgi:hypothetical protein
MNSPRDQSNQYRKWKATSGNKTESYPFGWMRHLYLSISVTKHEDSRSFYQRQYTFNPYGIEVNIDHETKTAKERHHYTVSFTN